MGKRYIENIQNFIGRKIQRARNQVENNCPELALKTLGEVEFYTRASLQLGLLPNSLYRITSKIEGIHRLIDRLRRMDKEVTS